MLFNGCKWRLKKRRKDLRFEIEAQQRMEMAKFKNTQLREPCEIVENRGDE